MVDSAELNLLSPVRSYDIVCPSFYLILLFHFPLQFQAEKGNAHLYSGLTKIKQQEDSKTDWDLQNWEQ